MTDESAFAGALRAVLASRDPGAAPARLAGVVRERLELHERARSHWWRARLANLGSVAAIAALGLIIAVALWRPQSSGPAASPLVERYVLAAGDGLVTGEHVPVFQGLGFVAIIGGLAVVAIRTRRKWTGILATVGALVAVLLAMNIGTSNALEFSGGGYGVTPYREATSGEPGMYVAVTGDQPFTLLVTVTNTSKLPLDLRGLAAPTDVRSSTGEPPILPRFVGLALLADEDLTYDAIVPFRPVTLQPGAHVNVAVLGLAGSCAIPDVGPEGQAGYQLETINLVYDQLTITHDAAFGLPEPVVITTTFPCS